MKFLYLDFNYVLPYCELSFWHRDHYRVSNYHIWSKDFKFGLRFKRNVQWGPSNLVKPWWLPDFLKLRGRQRCPKLICRVVPKTILSNKISNFKPFATTDSIGRSFKTSKIHVKTCVTLKSVKKIFFENRGIRKECNGWPL